jgi:flavin-binding protein dodecin
MAVVSRVTEVSAVSDKSFDDAIRAGIARAHETIRGLQSARVMEQEVLIGRNGEPEGYRVGLAIRFVLDGQIVTELAPFPNAATQTADFALMDESDSR